MYANRLNGVFAGANSGDSSSAYVQKISYFEKLYRYISIKTTPYMKLTYGGSIYYTTFVIRNGPAALNSVWRMYLPGSFAAGHQ